MSNPIYKDGIPEVPDVVQDETKPKKKTTRPRVSRKKKEDVAPTADAVETTTISVDAEDEVIEETTPSIEYDANGYYTVNDDDKVHHVNIADTVTNYEDDKEITWMVDDTSKPTPFDYGYQAKMTVDNYNLTRKDLFINRKVRSSDPSASFILGSIRSIDDAHVANPSEFYMDDKAISNVVSRNIWKIMAISAISQTNFHYDCYRYLMNDTNARWRSGVPLPDGRYRGIRSPALSLERARSSEKRAVDVMSDAMNMGKKRDIFLPHTGFSVTVRPPSLSEFVEYERKVIGDREDFLRKTRGLLLSSESSYIQAALFDLFVNCVSTTSAGETDHTFLLENISILDINTIGWVLACAKYPNGFNLTIPCFANPGTCNHFTNEIVAIDKMWIVDQSKISDKQSELAANMRNKATEETIAEYIDEFDYGDDKYVDIQTYDTDIGIRLVLGVPSIGQAFRSANVWRAAVENAANRSFNKPLVGNARRNYIKAQLNATRAMAYEAWVAEIEIYNRTDPSEEPVIVRDSENIREMITNISGNEHLLSQFLIGVEKFINRATVAVVALPNMACPACGGVHDAADNSEAGFHIIPLDVLSFFTILCRQQIQNSPGVAEAMENETTPNGEQSTTDISETQV